MLSQYSASERSSVPSSNHSLYFLICKVSLPTASIREVLSIRSKVCKWVSLYRRIVKCLVRQINQSSSPSLTNVSPVADRGKDGKGQSPPVPVPTLEPLTLRNAPHLTRCFLLFLCLSSSRLFDVPRARDLCTLPDPFRRPLRDAGSI